MTKIVDTNVVLIANRQHQGVSACCIAVCALELQTIMRQGRIALDDSFRILTEYQNKTQPTRGKNPGDVFVKWALNNNRNQARCDLVPVQEHPTRGFVSFPEDPELANFDPPDRVFVAVAAAHPAHPPILQAADSKWLDWAPALKRHGVEVDFVCKDDVDRFHLKKFGV